MQYVTVIVVLTGVICFASLDVYDPTVKMNAMQGLVQAQFQNQMPHPRFYRYVMTTKAQLHRSKGIVSYTITAIAVPTNCTKKYIMEVRPGVYVKVMKINEIPGQNLPVENK